MTEATKKKISDTLKRKNIRPPYYHDKPEAIEIRKKISESVTGFKHTDEAKKKISKACMGNKSTLGKTGSDANAWIDGRTSKKHLLRGRVEWKTWRKSVFERDNYTCQDCGAVSKKGLQVFLEPHHKTPVRELIDTPHEECMFDINNGTTLCRECHMKTFKRVK